MTSLYFSRKLRRLGLIGLILFAAGCSTMTQLGNVTGVTQALLSDPAVAGIINGPSPITTSFADTKQDSSLPAGFGDNLTATPLAQQPRDGAGGYLLAPGFYEMTCKSYCLHAGTSGPSAGDGYLYAPLIGGGQDVIQTIIRNSSLHPDLPQTTVQLLIWAVLAKAKFENLPADLKLASVELLTPQQIFELNGGALGLIPDSVLAKAVASLPAPVQQSLSAENSLRSLFAQASLTYQEAESLAVRPPAVGGPVYPSGGWSRHPTGYYVRYFPAGYTTTRVQVYVPASASPAPAAPGGALNAPASFGVAPVDYDATGNVAVPANTTAQRLAQSNDSTGGGPPPPPPLKKPQPTVELRLLNGLTPDFDGGTPTRIEDPDLFPDDTLAPTYLLANDNKDVLGVDLPLGTGRSLTPGGYFYSLMVLGKVTFPPEVPVPDPASVQCNWNRTVVERFIGIIKSHHPEQWNVVLLNKKKTPNPIPIGIPTPQPDMGPFPADRLQSFTFQLSKKNILYAHDNPGFDATWAEVVHPAPGDYLLDEKAFVYTLTVSAPGMEVATTPPFGVGQKSIVRRKSKTGGPDTDWSAVSNVASTSAIPDCLMPDDPAHVAIIRAIVGGTDPIVIDPHANDSD